MSIVNKDDEEESEVSARGFPTRFTPIHSTTTDLLRPNALTDSQVRPLPLCKLHCKLQRACAAIACSQLFAFSALTFCALTCREIVPGRTQ